MYHAGDVLVCNHNILQQLHPLTSVGFLICKKEKMKENIANTNYQEKIRQGLVPMQQHPDFHSVINQVEQEGLCRYHSRLWHSKC